MSKKWWVLATVAFGTFMATLDASIVNIALPTLTKELQTDLRSIKWVVIVYLLTTTCSLLPFGRLSDLYGRKKIFKWGFVVFTLGSLCCGFASTLQVLIFARMFQGLGASMLMANGPAIITAAFEVGMRARALSVLAMVVSIGLISGPGIGGFLISSMGWKSIFLVNIPFGVLGFIFAKKHIQNGTSKEKAGPFDWGGAFIQCLVLVTFILFVDPPTFTIAGSKPISISRGVVGVVLLFLIWIFAMIQKQVLSPILDLSLFKIRTFWAANLANFLNFISYSSILVLMPFYLEEAMGYSPDHAGVLMTAIPFTILVVAPLSGYLSDRMGSRGLSAVGAAIAALGLFFMAGAVGHGLYERTTTIKIILGLCTIGLASGLFQSPNNAALMSSIPPDKLGVASALMATIRNLGIVTGTGLAARVFSWRHMETGDFVKALHFSFIIAGVISIGAVLASLAKREVIRG